MSLKNASDRIVRGCGERQDQALYATVPMGAGGEPIESFLVDPPIRFDVKSQRGPRLVPDPEGTFHVVLGVGKEYYPTVPDFVEEARRFGVSKRLPRDFDPAKLTPGRSKLLLFHPRAIPDFAFYATLEECITGKSHPEGRQECIGELWPLSVLEPAGPKHDLELRIDNKGRMVWEVTTPSVTYVVPTPKVKGRPGGPTLEEEMKRPHPYKGGIFLSFPTWGFEYVSKSGEIPAEVVDRISRSKYKLRVVPQ